MKESQVHYQIELPNKAEERNKHQQMLQVQDPQESLIQRKSNRSSQNPLSLKFRSQPLNLLRKRRSSKWKKNTTCITRITNHNLKILSWLIKWSMKTRKKKKMNLSRKRLDSSLNPIWQLKSQLNRKLGSQHLCQKLNSSFKIRIQQSYKKSHYKSL